MKYNIKRESLTLPSNGNEETWDYITLYNNDDEVISRSKHHHPEDIIYHEYDDIVYVSGKDKEIMVTYNSLINKFK